MDEILGKRDGTCTKMVIQISGGGKRTGVVIVHTFKNGAYGMPYYNITIIDRNIYYNRL